VEALYRHREEAEIQATNANATGEQMTIVMNSARKQWRKRSNHVEVSLDEPLDDERQNFLSERIVDDSPDPEDMCRESELHERVRKLLTQMLAPVRKALQLRGVEGLKRTKQHSFGEFQRER
jgi:DNA-directed RNA polymerase sigma subunit (sigma70/sigma32)